ncbi:hypothetical protein N665_0432s0019 [Sinapis alba]|nr:hypothetical protein N665_0432s0019 [Sinapis alba]
MKRRLFSSPLSPIHHPRRSLISRSISPTHLLLHESTPGIALVHSNSRFRSFRCAVSSSGGDQKVSSRLSQVQQMLHEADERANSAGNEPTPQITLDHVTLNFARSGGPGGQNVNKVNTKLDMRFNVKTAYWRRIGSTGTESL